MVKQVLNIWFIRHAQSQANAGERTADPALIELTALGREQGSYVADLFSRAPDLLVTSPYLRARQTAQFVAGKHPAVPLETWPVQEFTYLDRQRCLNTTLAERIPMAREYWDRNDPHHVAGEGVESFAGLMERVTDMWGRLLAGCDGRWVAVFSHAIFIRAALWHWMGGSERVSETGMKRFRSFLRAYAIPNAALLKVRYDGEFWAGRVLTDHIPDHLRTN